MIEYLWLMLFIVGIVIGVILKKAREK